MVISSSSLGIVLFEAPTQEKPVETTQPPISPPEIDPPDVESDQVQDSPVQTTPPTEEASEDSFTSGDLQFKLKVKQKERHGQESLQVDLKFKFKSDDLKLKLRAQFSSVQFEQAFAGAQSEVSRLEASVSARLEELSFQVSARERSSVDQVRTEFRVEAQRLSAQFSSDQDVEQLTGGLQIESERVTATLKSRLSAAEGADSDDSSGIDSLAQALQSVSELFSQAIGSIGNLFAELESFLSEPSEPAESVSQLALQEYGHSAEDAQEKPALSTVA